MTVYVLSFHVGGTPGDSNASKVFAKEEDAIKALKQHRAEWLQDEPDAEIHDDNDYEFYIDSGDWWEYTKITETTIQ